ncbi:hypothetical protein Glo7428_2086 [Gloeocapsa sp. PCC 7428]|uniref:hypothetical protein n=1 Tax=Gloeocapsa sp. PCC 7428 TaxID=1173026 RepID=UPI0002A608E1|nr:hypothetical protein [Gloeocapsa sp. PCC 7428]AFZ30624.1 hypothetical protein Glo7428_2086 [Gloeocapsa sp. PCC 7428]
MAATITKVPQFRKGENVKFVGGVGTIKSYQLEAGSWTYAVEMAMGPEPEMGRIGYETTVLLNEADLVPQTVTFSSELAISA